MYLVGDLWGLQSLQGQSILGCVSIQLSVGLISVIAASRHSKKYCT